MAINFPDSPSNGDTHTAGGKTFTYDSTVGAWVPAAAGATTFIGLTDTPNSFGTASQIPAINSGANALEFIALPSSVTVYATVDLLPLSGNSAGDQALVTATNRLYIWNGSGWYNIALINTSPTISGVASSYTLASDGTDTVITITATDPEGLPITYSIASDTSGSVATVTQGTGANSNVFTITPSTNSANGGTFSLTFRASDGVNIATSVSSFTLEFKVVNSNYTTALITSVGANNAVNNSFVDSSSNNQTVTRYGNATQNTFSPYRKAGYSTYFDGNGDYLSLAYDSSFSFPAGTDFTIEAWVYPADATNQVIFSSYPGAGAGNWGWLITTANRLSLYVYPNATFSYWTPTGADITPNTWNHVALTRSGTTWSMFVNGALAGSVSVTQDMGTGSNPLLIGQWSSGSYFNGYIAEARIVKGTAVYTSAFTPPTDRLTAITNTSLLTCHLPYIADGSTNDHTITVNGNTSTKPFTHYDVLTYDASTDGGSLYIPGATGNHLTFPAGTDLAMGAGDFTHEFWFYPTGYTSYYYGDTHGLIWSQDANGTNYFGIGLGSPTSRNITFTYGTSGGGSTVSSSGGYGSWIPNTWNHVAVVRSSGTLTVYLNGKGGTPVSVSQDFNNTTYVPTIGRYSHVDELRFEGSISDYRIVKGTAVYTSDFTPPTAPLTAITNTSLLLNGTNAGIIDKSQSVQTMTLNGDVKSSTTQTKYLSSSMYFDGTGDYLQIPWTNQLYFANSDWTVEGWFYRTITSDYCVLFENGYTGAGTTRSINIYTDNASSGLLRIAQSEDGSTNYDTSLGENLPANSWTHVAVVRYGSTVKCYINGSNSGTSVTARSLYNSSTKDFFIGIQGDLQAVTTFAGYISDFRVTKGLARYTANFTPPTAELKG